MEDSINDDFYSDLTSLCGNETVENGWCPSMFDGMLCWNSTPPGTTANQTCPPSGKNEPEIHLAFKECWKNGSWFVNAENQTWTNYAYCSESSDKDLEFYRSIKFLYIVGYSVSSVALIASIIIFFSFRILRCPRIRIHVQLFLSFLLNNILSIVWYTEVVSNVEVTKHNPFWCVFLHISKEYFMVASYMWMFCEALHLYIALELVYLSEERTMKWFYGIGWGMPVLIVIIHNAVRIFFSKDTGRCFMEQASQSTWYITIPVALSLIASMVFLVDILRVILTIRNPSSPNPAPDGVKKALRAAFILIPLFGLQFILIPVKPDSLHPLYTTHQYFSAIIISYQGLCCAILFCFANNEVHHAIKRSFQRTLSYHSRSTHYQTGDTNGGIVTNGRVSNGNVIPLLSVHHIEK